MTRIVVVLCGPPGAGKTTAARASGLQVYDADDEHWPNQGQFVRAIAALAHDPDARAVVIRSAPTTTARTKWRALTRATHCLLITTDPDESAARIRARGRNVARELVALRAWHARHDRLDGVRAFTGWDQLGPATDPPPRQTPTPRKGTAAAGYGYRHRRLRERWQQRIDAGQDVRCWRCGTPLVGTAWDLGHDDHDRSQYRGPECIPCNRATSGRLVGKRQAQDVAEREPTSRRW